MDTNTALKNRILTENQNAHDYFAPQHDSVCSYIARDGCRDYYSRMIVDLSRWNEREASKCKVLELGCGTGTWVAPFSEAKEYVGVDISPGMVAAARKKHADPTRTFHCGDVVEFLEREIAVGSRYDVIVSSSFLHHLFDIDQVVNLIGKVLASSGVYVAIHEPIKPLNARSFPLPLGKRIDERLAYLMGYDCDLPANPPLKRVAQLVKSAIPFKASIKKLLGRGNTAGDLGARDDSCGFVDYKLSDGQVFHPVIFANRVYPGLSVDFDIYSYYAYPRVGRLFGEASNYFYVRFSKT